MVPSDFVFTQGDDICGHEFDPTDCSLILFALDRNDDKGFRLKLLADPKFTRVRYLDFSLFRKYCINILKKQENRSYDRKIPTQ